jgi:hypothetical protein
MSSQQNCTINAIPNSCNLNPKCICSDAGFINAITCCVAGKCDQADQEGESQQLLLYT